MPIVVASAELADEEILRAFDFHVTMTEAGGRPLASHAPERFAAFIARNAHLVGRVRLDAHFSPERLKSERARNEWVEPDREPLPPPVDRVDDK